jgi:HK97 family phage prohead protease
MSYTLPMEIREVDATGRMLDGVAVPYDEVSYFTPNPDGERVRRGAFTKSAQQRLGKIFLYRGHDHAHPVGRAVSFADEPDGLHASFHIRESVLGDETIADLKDGYLPGLSVGFRPLQTRRGSAGETEIIEGQLMECSLVPMAAYDGARVLALRSAWNLDHVPQPVAFDLSPIVPGWVYRADQ